MKIFEVAMRLAWVMVAVLALFVLQQLAPQRYQYIKTGSTVTVFDSRTGRIYIGSDGGPLFVDIVAEAESITPQSQ